MNGEKTDDDVQHFATCTYCGTQTGLSLKRLEGDKPLKCRTCGAPLKVVPPPKRPPKKRKKPGRDYGVLQAERHEYDRRLDKEKKTAMAVAGIMIVALFFITLLLLERC